MNKFQIKLIEDAVASLSKLNDWEQKFIRNMKDLADNFPKTELTFMQNRTLNLVNTKVVRATTHSPSRWTAKEYRNEHNSKLRPLEGTGDYVDPDEEESE
jgi:hypothetical protein